MTQEDMTKKYPDQFVAVNNGKILFANKEEGCVMRYLRDNKLNAGILDTRSFTNQIL